MVTMVVRIVNMCNRMVIRMVRLVIKVVRIFNRMSSGCMELLEYSTSSIILSLHHYNDKEIWSSLGLSIYISNFIVTI